ncbi:MAG: BlaR1 peptidase M56 [Lutibacter sp.]|uniref:M56 family metallopeptidase n=1 Tax=Lutibacter sp. TaxID=1925666 RepID=UPI0018225F97|nr:M56 family metallopeptidase [Lutibacter sp.]MBT8317588.1 M56 family metallopeptidase [Lutibacter sp.]NNJ58447.1 BlaR1 peptidase M56 [Lutibacter sp.]
MINYILQILLFQVLFLAVYDIFLQKETFFKWNRIYLLITPFLSFLIPFLKFKSIQQTVPQEYVVQLPTVFLNPQVIIEQHVTNQTTINYLPYIFISGVLLFSIIFLLKLFKIQKLISKNIIVRYHKYKLVLLTEKKAAFSFFNYIFIHKKLKDNKELDIIQHEIIHCKQKHTIDLLLFELLKIVMWFNPLIYVYQNRITVLHEYISDAEVIKETSKKSYFNSLLSETFNVENISFTNQFYKHSLLKKRIIMITKEKSKKMKQLKYLLVLPLLVSMLIYVSCTDDAQAEIEQIENVLKEEMIPSEGKYFRAENGFIMFLGTHLAGEVVPFDNYTLKEKEIFNKFNERENPKIETSIVIDENGDRVHFIKVPKPPIKNSTQEIEIDDSVPFAIIEEVPIYPGCEGNKEQLRVCLQEKITELVASNFNSKMANELGLKAGVSRIFVLFKIDKDGTITEVKARAPHKELQEEAIRVINLLPKMVPGKQKGENVAVKYSLPIAFKVQ